ncbi:hypothetical protein GKE82_06350 [Conexibacter sp. W3-3-2]|uniref:hypothetical protein n=1 Tax=Solirubrobacterales TaxID=588673 RepID=UPI0011B20FED|nr:MULTISPECIES: hypothetical protein [Solirubrobacterales]MTD43934.1 hypothetical protein [Conexibacter sp. W3-3-2]
MSQRAVVDWGSEDLLPTKGRQIDDWTAGDDLDFTVRQRRRITGDRPAAAAPRHQPAEHDTRRTVTGEHPVHRTRAVQRTVIVEGDAPRQPTRERDETELLWDEPRRAPGPDGEDRRTVAITGRPELLPATPRLREVEPRRRATRSPVDQAMSRPDRIALWAVGLGFLLILIAALSGGA